MQGLIKIENQVIGAKNVNSVNARELHEALEIKKPFADWIKTQIKRAGIRENIDYITFKQQSDGGRPTQEYIITAGASKHIAMMSQGDKATEVRDYFIEIEEVFLNKLQKAKLHIANGYKSQLAQRNAKIKELENRMLLLESGLDKKIDYRVKAKALYPVILNRMERIEAEFSKEFAGQSLMTYKKLLDEIVQLLSREARVCTYMTFLGNGTAVNNGTIEDDKRELRFS